MSVEPSSHDVNIIRDTGISLRIVTAFDKLQTLEADWLELLRRSSANEPMLSTQWLLPWWRVYGVSGGRSLQFGLFYQGDRLIGIAPMQRRTFRHRFGLTMSRIEFLGADVDEEDGVCSEYLNLIVEQGRERDVVAAFVEALKCNYFGTWHELVLSAMDGDGSMPNLLMSALSEAGLRTEQAETTSACYIPLPKSWEEYLSTLGKHRRYVNKTLRDFEKWAEGTANFIRADTPEQLSEGIRILHELHGQRWQGQGQPGVFASDRFRDFHEQVMQRLWQEELLDLYWLTAHDRPLAAIYNFRWDNKVYFYQSGRQVDLPNSVRVGIVLQKHCIEQAIQTGCREYDFLGGPTQYKRQLSPTSRPIIRIRATRPGTREHVRQLTETCVNLARRVRNGIRNAFASK